MEVDVKQEQGMTQDESVIIVLTKSEWNESSKAMKILMKLKEKKTEKEKEKEKAQKISVDVLNSIDTLFQHIFSKDKNVKEEKVVVDIYTEMKRLTSNEFENILDQIKNEDQHHENDGLKQQFYQSFDGFEGDGLQYYKINSLNSVIENDYEFIYQDFLSINNKLIDGELKDLLLKHSNKNDVDFIYDKHIIRRRNICSLFPFKHWCKAWDKYGSDYISLINELNGNKNDKLKMFCLLYNCMASIFVTSNADGDRFSNGNGLDKYGLDYIGITGNSDVDLCGLCERYILISMLKTGIFGDEHTIVPGHESEFDVYSSSIVSFIISNVFDNDLTSLKKLLKYCIQDIKYNNDIKKLKDAYTLNHKKELYGILFFVLNRFTYYIYCDLLCISSNNDCQLLFPKLKNFAKFLYNFAVYCHCYTNSGVYDARRAEDAQKLKEYEGLCCITFLVFCFVLICLFWLNVICLNSILPERVLSITKYIV